MVVGPRRGVPFYDNGDSGSLVVDEQGHVVGLLWAQADDDVTVTDIRVVFESIREKMGWGPNTVFSASIIGLRTSRTRRAGGQIHVY